MTNNHAFNAFVSICKVKSSSVTDGVSHFSDVADNMEHDERRAQSRQTRLNPFDRREDEDGPQGGKTPPHKGYVY